MTRGKIEELEKEAKEYAEENQIYVGEYCSYNHLVKAYLVGAEPREKQIQIDAEQIRALQKDKGELTDRVKELEAQIEKMKCCGNCAKYNSGYGETPCKLFASGICGEWETSIGKF